MNFFLYLLLSSLVISMVAVASNPAPYFAALGLVVAAGAGCGILVWYGGSFLSLVLFLIYLGGMLVVFAYSTALAADAYPKSWGDKSVIMDALGKLLFLMAAIWYFRGDLKECLFVSDEKGKNVLRAEVVGVALLFSCGGFMVSSGGYGLFLTLIVVLELTRGFSCGTFRTD
uniref:NADH-ubiquinone oxidoreductase chain 6 n=1 Tax=Megalamphodus socolofi TaxID=2979627 RepID=A0A977KCV1_9TELE|nr:NADH dehydrogenase subunit 6 [Hyphessobrycon socolofi]UXD78964.1 NADH dehydrogenase subunit 6 [Hyphessobrycon socolofi]